MIQCEICKKEYHRITKAHVMKHSILNEKEYIRLYPYAKLYDEFYINNISTSTKNAMNKMDKTKFHMALKKRNENGEYIKKLSDATKKAHIDGKLKNIYTDERNKKVSEARIQWCKDNPKEMSDAGKKRHKRRIEKNGLENYLLKQKESAAKAYKVMARKKGFNEFEKRLYKILTDENIKFEPQHELEGKFFDAFLPDFNTLLEFDGDFYHKESLNDCKYDFQIKNLNNDMVKDFIARKNKFNIIRIKEKDNINSIINLLPITLEKY